MDTSDDITQPLRTCSKCGRDLPASREFFGAANGTGLRGDCKICHRVQARAYHAVHRTEIHSRQAANYMAHRETRLARMKAYSREHGEELTAKARIWRAEHREEIATRMAAYYACHRAERDAYKNAYRASHREAGRLYATAYVATHPEATRDRNRHRRALKAGANGTHTAEDIQAQYERQKGKCFYCQKKVGDNYHVDHVTPLSKGGGDGPENLVIACGPCNLAKHAKHPMDFCGRLL